MLGASSSSLVGADFSNVTKTFSDLSIQSFSLKNTYLNPTGGYNAQIIILSLSITYIQN